MCCSDICYLIYNIRHLYNKKNIQTIKRFVYVRGVISIKAKNKVIAGKYKEYQFRNKRGRLCLCCLENEVVINSTTLLSVQEIDYSEYPKGASMLARGYVGNVFFGTLGMIVGLLTAKRREIFRLRIDFAEGGTGIVEVDDLVYEKIMHILYGYA